MKRYNLGLLFFLIVYYGQAQQLTKGDAIRLTLANNYNIAIANNNLEIADNNTDVLNSGYLPTLEGIGQANYQRATTTTSFPGFIDPETALGRPDIVIDGAETQRYDAGLSANYLLFDGLGRYYNYKSLKEQYNITELQVRETIENTFLELFTIYYQVARLSENQTILEENLNISQNRVKRATYRFEYGQDTKLGVLNAEVDVVNDSISLLNLKQDLSNAKRDLNLVMNRELQTSYSVDTLVQFIPELQLQEFIATSTQNNVSLLLGEQNVRLSDWDIRVQKAGYLPTIGLVGTYNWNQSRNPPGVFFPGTLSNGTVLSAGVNLNWNLFDGGQTITNVKNAKLQYENRALEQQQIAETINRDIKNAWTTYQNRTEIYRMQQQNVLTNENNFERSKERFNIGQITSIEFRQAQLNLANAKASQSLAKYDAKIAEIQLLRLTGQLLNNEF